MHLDLHVYFHLADLVEVKARLDQIMSNVVGLSTRIDTMSAALDALSAEVARNTAVDESAITLLNGLATQIADLKNDPVALQALSDSLKSSSDALAAAVIANTPTA
jgi:hypothetical protein